MNANPYRYERLVGSDWHAIVAKYSTDHARLFAADRFELDHIQIGPVRFVVV